MEMMRVSLFPLLLLLTAQNLSEVDTTLLKPTNSRREMALHDVLTAVEWDHLLMLCETSTRCPSDHVLSVRQAVHLTLDLDNRSQIVQVFENYGAPETLKWLVFCVHCETLLEEINVFEDTHDLHGYFTYCYQWIIVDYNSKLSALESRLGKITNLFAISTDMTFHTAMFGERRYFQEIQSKQFPTPDRNHYFPNLLTGLNNATLVVSGVHCHPYVITDESGASSDYFIEVLRMIAEHLNFTIKMTEPDDGQYGALKDGEWTGVMRQLVDKEVDIGALLTYSYERGQYVTQLSTAVSLSYMGIIYHKPESISMSTEILLHPFSWQVWCACLLAVLITMGIFHTSNKWLGQSGNGSYVLRTTLNQGSQNHPVHQSGRIIYSVYSICWTVLVSTYIASLVSLLSVKKEVIPFRTMAEVVANTEYDVGVTGGSVLYDAIFRQNLSQYSPIHHLQTRISQDVVNDPRIISSDYALHEKRVITEKYAYYAANALYNALASNSCHIGMLEEKGEAMLDGFMLQKNSAYAKDIDNVLLRIKEGDLDKNLRKALPKPKTCTEIYNNVSLENCHGIFCILFTGLAMGFVILILEMLFSLRCFAEITELLIYMLGRR